MSSRPPLILIHGFRGSPIGLEAIARRLRAADYQVYVPAIPPFGGAAPLPRYTAKSYANFIRDYIKQQRLDHPVLIGHSMGSIIATATAATYPHILSSRLVLMSPISTRTAKPFTLISPLSNLTPRRVVDYVTTRFLFVPHNRVLFHETLDLTHLCSADQPPARSDLAQATYFSTHSAVADFSLSQDVLLLAGERDRLISQRDTLALASRLHAQLVFIPGSGHLHNYEKPAETAEHILNFLEPRKAAPYLGTAHREGN